MFNRPRSLSPYTAGEQPLGETIKLNTNENPYPPDAKTLETAWRNLRLYPDPNAAALCAEIAKREGLSAENVFVGNGSDEVLAMAFMALFDSSDTIAAPRLTYSFYPVFANLFNLNYKEVDMNADYSVNVDGLSVNGNCVVLANPNAPTGMALPLSEILRIAKNKFLMVDEAYINFGGETAAKHISDNLCVVRTFSKGYSLAGARVGYMLGTPKVINALNTVKNCFNSYTVSSMAQAIALAALQNEEYYRENAQKIIAERNLTKEKLSALGLESLPSSTNFLFVKTQNAQQIYHFLKQKGVLVRYFPSTPNFLRITIGTPAQMDALLRAIEECLNKLQLTNYK